jgi:thioredoxin reductase
LSVLLLKPNVPGGQAGSSSRIENYLGFPTGISGLELTGRAYAQALKFGASIGHVFMMTGAVPNTRWLDGCIALDAKGFVKTGSDLSSDELAKAKWPLARPPYLLETNRPGIFAVGDVRGGNVKRVASAVGEGSIAVALVHQALRQ